MKKLFILICITAALVGCSSKSSKEKNTEDVSKEETESGLYASDEAKKELELFIEDYNELAKQLPSEHKIELFNSESLKAPNKEHLQSLHDSDGATVELVYSDSGDITGYHVSVGESSNYNIAYATTVAKVLGVDILNLGEEIRTMAESEEDRTEYEENGYKVSLLDARQFDMYFVYFDKL